MIPDLQFYNDRKEKGLISIQKIDSENYALCEKKYDLTQAALGVLVELPAEVKGITMTEIDEEISKITEEKDTRLTGLKALRADLMVAV